MMPTTESTTSSGANTSHASGNSALLKRTKPYVPILRRTAARITEPVLGASTWASGSQVWRGKSGTLMPNARANAAKTRSPGANRLPVVGSNGAVFRKSR